MTANLTQQIELSARPHLVYEALLDSAIFAAVSGAPAQIERQEGGAISLFGGTVRGQIQQLHPDKLIVQSWHVDEWGADALPSTVTFDMEPSGTGTRIYLTHTGFPADHHAKLDIGWHNYYWQPLEKHFGVHSTSSFYDEAEKLAEAMEADNWSFASLAAGKILDLVFPARDEDAQADATSTAGLPELHKTVKALDAKNFDLASLCLRKAVAAFETGAVPTTLELLDSHAAGEAALELGRALTTTDFSLAASSVRKLAHAFRPR